MKSKRKILSKVSAVVLAVVILCASMIPAFAATNWAEGARGIEHRGVHWNADYEFNYTDATNKTTTVHFGNNVDLGVFYFAKSGETLYFGNNALRAFCVEPEKATGTSSGKYNRDEALSDVYSYTNRLTDHQRRLLNYVLASGYGSYIPTTNQAYWYATQLLIFEVVTGMRQYNNFELVNKNGKKNGSNTTLSGLKPQNMLVVSPNTTETKDGKNKITAETIQTAYDNMVDWMRIATNDPSGVSSNSNSAPVYQMEYRDGKYIYVYHDDNNIVRTAHKDTNGVRRSAMNFTSDDLTVSDPSVKATISDRTITFTSDKPINGEVLVSLRNARQRGLKEMAQEGSGNVAAIGNLTIITAGDNNKQKEAKDQAFARGASPVVTTRYFKLAAGGMKLRLQKVSSCPGVSNNNSMYSLEGAKFNIYTSASMSDSSLFGTITTDANGYGVFGEGEGADVPVQTYYAKEIEAPKGFTINDNGGQPFVFADTGQRASNGASIYSFTCADTPENDPMYVFIKKVDAVTYGGNADLAGAKFEVKYYDGIYNTESEIAAAGAQPKRAWVFKTDENGNADYSEESKVSGDNLYYDPTGWPVLPLGTVTIKEIAEPTSGKYLINDQTFIRVIDKGITVREDQYPTENTILIEETPKTAGLTIKKTANGGRVNDLWFEVRNNQGTLVGRFKTNNAGLVLDDNNGTLANLLPGKYFITELGLSRGGGSYSMPKGYTADTTQQSVTLVQNQTTAVTFHNTPIRAKVNLQKESEDNLIANLWFKMTGTDGKEYFAATNNQGKLSFTNLPVYDDNENLISYTIEELGRKSGDTYKFPREYIKPENQTFTFATNTTSPVKNITFENLLKKSGLTLRKRSSDNNRANIWFELRAGLYNGQVVAVAKTNETGIIDFGTFRKYDSNGNYIWYVARELGYLVDEANQVYKPSGCYYYEDEVGVILPENMAGRINYTNTPRTFNLEVEKSASDGKIENIEVRVRSLNSGYSYDETKRTDANGTVTFEGLRCYETKELTPASPNDVPIRYEVTEIGYYEDGSHKELKKYYGVNPVIVDGSNYPGNFVFDEDEYDYIFTPDTANAEIHNEEKPGAINITKASGDNVIEHIWFRVQNNAGYDQKYETDENGKIEIFGLNVFFDNGTKITYTVTELGEKQTNGSYKIPDRYISEAPKSFTLNSGNDPSNIPLTYTTFTNTLKTGSLTVVKTDSANRALKNVTFKLYKANGNELGEQVGTEKVTNDSGRAVFSNLALGNYKLVEVKSAPGFSLISDPIDVTIRGESTTTLNRTVNVTNTSKLELPPTGGSNGIVGLAIGGSLVLIACVGIVIVIIKKRK